MNIKHAVVGVGIVVSAVLACGLASTAELAHAASSRAADAPARASDRSCSPERAGPRVAAGAVVCDRDVLYRCVEGRMTRVVDCEACPFVGEGTRTLYRTRCEDSANAAQGPGCYFGLTAVCR